MSNSPLTGRFKWLDLAKFNFDKYHNNSSRAFVLEVDFKYPKELHKLLNDYPLAPEKLEIKILVTSFFNKEE